MNNRLLAGSTARTAKPEVDISFSDLREFVAFVVSQKAGTSFSRITLQKTMPDKCVHDSHGKAHIRVAFCAEKSSYSVYSDEFLRIDEEIVPPAENQT